MTALGAGDAVASLRGVPTGAATTSAPMRVGTELIVTKLQPPPGRDQLVSRARLVQPQPQPIVGDHGAAVLDGQSRADAADLRTLEPRRQRVTDLPDHTATFAHQGRRNLAAHPRE